MGIPEIIELGHDVELLQAENAALRAEMAELRRESGEALAIAAENMKAIVRGQAMLDGAATGLACACQGIVAAIDQASADGQLVAHLKAQLAKVEAREASSGNDGAVLALREVLRSSAPGEAEGQARSMLN